MREWVHVLHGQLRTRVPECQTTPPSTAVSNVLTTRQCSICQLELALAVWYRTPGTSASRFWTGTIRHLAANFCLIKIRLRAVAFRQITVMNELSHVLDELCIFVNSYIEYYSHLHYFSRHVLLRWFHDNNCAINILDKDHKCRWGDGCHSY